MLKNKPEIKYILNHLFLKPSTVSVFLFDKSYVLWGFLQFLGCIFMVKCTCACLWVCMFVWVSECESMCTYECLSTLGHTHLSRKIRAVSLWAHSFDDVQYFDISRDHESVINQLENTAARRMPTDQDENLETHCCATISSDNNTQRWHSPCSGFPTC